MAALLKPIEIAEQKVVNGRPFPLTLTPESESSLESIISWITSHRDDLLERAMHHGAILFRNCPVETPEEFAAFIEAFYLENMPYVGGAAVRRNIVGDRVFTANESPPSEPIPFHHEMAQVHYPPSYLFFYCDVAPSTGGETPIILSNQVYEFLSSNYPDFCQRLEQLGVKYTRVLPTEDDPTSAIGRSWKSTFLVESKEEAENKMKELGTEWEWLPNGDLITTTATIPAIRQDHRTGIKTFFNSVVAAYTGWVDSRNDPTKAVRLGDDTAIDEEALNATVEFMHNARVYFRWERKDILFVDNRVAMHSRNTFDPPRRILASIARDPIPITTPESRAFPSSRLASGAFMPMIGMGVWKVPKNVTAISVENAIAQGYRHLDCACDYGNEKEVGEGIKNAIAKGLVSREELFVTGKLWNTYHRREHVGLALNRTLSDLELDYIDLFLIHFPISLKFVPFEVRYPPEWFHDPTVDSPRMELDPVPIRETWEAMEQFVKEGKVRDIGVCNFNCQGLRDLLSYAQVPVSVLQVEMHPYLTQEKLLRMASEHGIVVTAYSPLGAGSYVELGGSTMEESALREQVVVDIASKYNKTPAQILLRWGVQRGTAVIPKSSKLSRLVENISIFDFELTAEEMALISGLNKNRRFNDPGVFCEGAFNTFCPIYE